MLCLNVCTNSFVCRSGLIRRSKANRVNNCWSASGFLCVILYCYLCTWDSCDMYIITTHRQVSQLLPLQACYTSHLYYSHLHGLHTHASTKHSSVLACSTHINVLIEISGLPVKLVVSCTKNFSFQWCEPINTSTCIGCYCGLFDNL